MLTSIVLTLKPNTTAIIPTFLGRAAHAWFLDQLRQTDPRLADRLHTPNLLRPFTVSPLWSPSAQARGNGVRLNAGQTCHLRVTSVEAELSALLMKELAPRWIDEMVYLVGVPFQVKEIAASASEHPQAAHSSYEAFITSLEKSRLPAHVTLRFLTPTTFRRSPPPDAPFGDDAYDVPIPTPELLFGGLLALWNTFAPQPLPEELRTFARDRVVISRYQLRTELVSFGSGRRGRVGGFVGQCRFAILDADEIWRRRIGLLAAFAPFAGVGRRTTMGLGQVQSVARG